jgi:hypothetical protein
MIYSTLPAISGEQTTSELQSGLANPLRCFTGARRLRRFYTLSLYRPHRGNQDDLLNNLDSTEKEGSLS